MPTIYRAMGLDAASNRYPPDIQHSRHTESFIFKDRQVVQLVSACNLPNYKEQVEVEEECWVDL